jgi:hypothetical protein
MEKLKSSGLPLLLRIKLYVVCQAKDIKHEKKLGNEKSHILLCVRQQVMAGFCSRRIH